MARRGRRWHGADLVIQFAPAAGPVRFGLAVSRKVGGAVVRNRVKRHLREHLRHRREGLAGFEAVVIARPSAAKASGQDLARQVDTALGFIQRKLAQGSR